MTNERSEAGLSVGVDDGKNAELSAVFENLIETPIRVVIRRT